MGLARVAGPVQRAAEHDHKRTTLSTTTNVALTGDLVGALMPTYRTLVLCSADVERRYELENMRRSLAMLTPGDRALTREEALRLVEELAAVQAQLDRLRDGLRRLIADE